MYKTLNTTHLIKLCLFFCQSKILGRCLLLEIVHYVLAQFVLLNNTKSGKYFQAVCIITTIKTMQLVSAKYEMFIDSLNTTFTLTLQTRSGLLFYFFFMFGKLVFQFTCESIHFVKVLTKTHVQISVMFFICSYGVYISQLIRYVVM